MIQHFSRFALASVLSVAATTSVFAVELIMVDQQGCHYCEAWLDEIGPAYPKTAEGKFAPLKRRDISDGAPDGSTYARRVNFTPTFILLDEGTELARIEGYPGQDFFWPILNKLLIENTSFIEEGS